MKENTLVLSISKSQGVVAFALFKYNFLLFAASNTSSSIDRFSTQRCDPDDITQCRCKYVHVSILSLRKVINGKDEIEVSERCSAPLSSFVYRKPNLRVAWVHSCSMEKQRAHERNGLWDNTNYCCHYFSHVTLVWCI